MSRTEIILQYICRNILVLLITIKYFFFKLSTFLVGLLFFRVPDNLECSKCTKRVVFILIKYNL